MSRFRQLFSATAHAARHSVIAQAAGPVPAPPPVAGTGATTFDALYDPSFRLNSDEAYVARTALARPTVKSTGLTDVSFTDPGFGVKNFLVTKTSEIPDSGVGFLRNDYSKRQHWNCDGTRYLAFAENAWWHLYNADTFAHINIPGSTSGRLPFAGDDADVHWDPVNPNIVYYTGMFGGLVFNQCNIATGQVSTAFDLTALRPAGFQNVTYFTMKGEGRPSVDGRYWCFMGLDASFNMIGLICYDKQLHQIVSSVLTTNKPNWCGMSNSGAYCILNFLGHPQGGVSWAVGKDLPMNGNGTYPRCFGSRAYPRAGLNGSVWTHIDMGGDHGDPAYDTAGNDVYFTVTYSPNMDVPGGSVYYRRLDTGEAFVYQGWSDYWTDHGLGGMHFSGTCFSRPGYAFMAYNTYGYTPVNRAGTMCVVKLDPSTPTPRRLGHHRMDTGVYFATPFPNPNRDGTRVMWASDWGNTGQPYEQCMMGLPSWALDF